MTEVDMMSEHGVECVTPAWQGEGTVTLTIPRYLLEDLQIAWQQDSATPLVEAVRDLFDGGDGALQYLARIGIKTEPR